MRANKVKWPAIIKYHGDNELTYVGSGSEWDADIDLHAAIYDEADRLIDSEGSVFSLRDKAIEPKVIEESLELVDMVDLLRAHFSSIGECCVSKFSISSIAEGITTVGQFEER